ncbi:hypothetical protein WJX72_010015 [[Myrmecia] bisecta]|uniref:Methyltransferase type 11 domain-containing protein n=1 Tax=[Myrmecia] bisecta TaxID=41462 RepID=A0AAW1QSF2_9CHLO
MRVIHLTWHPCTGVQRATKCWVQRKCAAIGCGRNKSSVVGAIGWHVKLSFCSHSQGNARNTRFRMGRQGTYRPACRLTAVCRASGGGTISREVLSRADRTKLDSGNDRQFYDSPRLVKHVDDGFLAQVTQLYRERIRPGSAVLDLMSSWVSHLPADVSYSKVVGHGMNAAELARNKQLTSFFVRNLNEEPRGWAAADQSFDAVTVCVSVQYLQQPEQVFAEIYRVLKPGGVCLVTFSNRLYYSKAIQAWRDNSGFGRASLVKQYFQCVEGFTQPEAITQVEVKQPTEGVQGLLAKLSGFMKRAQGDPFYAIVAYRNFKPVHDS